MGEFKVRSVTIDKEFDLFFFHLLFCSQSDLVQSKCLRIKEKNLRMWQKKTQRIVRIEILHEFASQYLKESNKKTNK